MLLPIVVPERRRSRKQCAARMRFAEAGIFGATTTDQRSLFSGLHAGRFKGAMSRWLTANGGREFHVARYGVRCFKFSVEPQCPWIPSDVTKEKFHRARKCRSVSLAFTPLCL